MLFSDCDRRNTFAHAVHVELPKVNPELTQALLGGLTDVDKTFLEEVQTKAQERQAIAAAAAAKAQA